MESGRTPCVPKRIHGGNDGNTLGFFSENRLMSNEYFVPMQNNYNPSN